MFKQGSPKHDRRLIRLIRQLLSHLYTTLTSALMACALALPLQADEAAPTISLTNGHWPPYMENTPPHYGVISQIVTLASPRKTFPYPMAFSLGPALAFWRKKAGGTVQLPGPVERNY
nr:hypothetical protein [Marinobacter sp. DS40M8]